MYGEKARQELHKNDASNIEQILEPTPYKAEVVRPPSSHQENYQVRRTRHAGHCWRSKNELIKDIFLWTPSNERTKAGRPTRPYILQRCR